MLMCSLWCVRPFCGGKSFVIAQPVVHGICCAARGVVEGECRDVGVTLIATLNIEDSARVASARRKSCSSSYCRCGDTREDGRLSTFCSCSDTGMRCKR
jgi:hypothetical protein